MDCPSIIFGKIALGKYLIKCSSITTYFLYLVECYVCQNRPEAVFYAEMYLNGALSNCRLSTIDKLYIHTLIRIPHSFMWLSSKLLADYRFVCLNWNAGIMLCTLLELQLNYCSKLCFQFLFFYLLNVAYLMGSHIISPSLLP